MEAPGGWVGKILRVDLSAGKVWEESTYKYVPKFLGGRGIGAKICWDEVPPEVGAFDPENRLVFATGALQGTMAPSSGRLMVMGKAAQGAPVESYIRSGCGGHFAPEMKWAGYDAIVVQGKAATPVYLWVSDGHVEILDASRLWGLDTYQTQEQIWQTHGKKARALVIGRAGEMRSRIAVIMTDSGDASGQGGFGGVMGSKNLKAIVVRGTGNVRVARPKALMELTHHIQGLFMRKPLAGDPYQPMEKGFSYNAWSGSSQRGGLTLLAGELLDLTRDPASGYKQVPDGCYACPVSCRSRVTGPDIVPGVALCAQAYMYLESLVHDPEKGYSKVTWNAAKLGDLVGVNAYELMAILPWLADCYREELIDEETTGLPMEEIGSWKFISKLMNMIANREGFGDSLSEGGQRAAAKLGGKAQEISKMYYPRAGRFAGYREHWTYLGGYPTGWAVPGLGLMWCLDHRDVQTSHHYVSMMWGAACSIGLTPLTADPEKIIPVLRPVMKACWGSEEAGEFVNPGGKTLNWKGVAPVTKLYYERSLLKDSYITCDIMFPFIYNPNTKDHVGDTSLESKLFSAVTGIDQSEEESYKTGEMLATLERAIACRDGRTRNDDVLHDEYYSKKDAAGRQYVRADMERAKSDYYRLMGWNDMGIPTRATLERLGLPEVAEGLEKRGILKGEK